MVGLGFYLMLSQSAFGIASDLALLATRRLRIRSVQSAVSGSGLWGRGGSVCVYACVLCCYVWPRGL